MVIGILGNTAYDILKSIFKEVFGQDNPLADNIYEAIDVSSDVFFGKYGKKYGEPNESFLARQENINQIMTFMKYGSDVDLKKTLNRSGYGDVPDLSDEDIDFFINELKNQMSKDYELDKVLTVKQFISGHTSQTQKLIESFLEFKGDYNKEQAEKILFDILEFYCLKTSMFVVTQSNKLAFKSEEDNELIGDEWIDKFFSSPTWKLNIILSIKSLKKNPLNAQFGIHGTVEYLLDICQKRLNYKEFEFEVRKVGENILKALPIKEKASNIRSSIINIFRLLNQRYNKIALIVGEPGSGKTYLANKVVSSNIIDKESRYFSLRIPITISKTSPSSIEEQIVASINLFMDTEFSSLKHIDLLIKKLEEYVITITFIIDDLQTVCFSIPGFYENFKEFIEESTTYDWISWLITINEYDQYLLFDKSDFLDKYCYRIEREDVYGDKDTFNTFINMSELNVRYKTCKKILLSYGIDYSEIEESFVRKIDNFKMLLDNPLISHVYANTIESNEKELLNICYFDFIRRFAEIKKKKIIEYSQRKLSSQIEIKTVIERELDFLLKYIIDNKRLIYEGTAYYQLLEYYEELLKELQKVHLVRKVITEEKDPLEENGVSEKISFHFIFKLYWAYKILIFYKNRCWSDYLLLRDSFIELKDELLSYEILYLDKENMEKDLHEVLSNIAKRSDGKEIVFLVALKTSFKCQAYIFKLLLSGQYFLSLSKAEVFSMMYFLTYSTSAKIPQRCTLLSKHFKLISNYDFGFYVDGSVRRMLSSLKNLTKLKKCLVEFISCEDIYLSKIVGEVAAENFFRIAILNSMDLESILHQLVCFIYNNEQNIRKYCSICTEKGKKNASTFAEYFIRSLFGLLIDSQLCTSDRMLLHKTLQHKNYYFEMQHVIISYIIRASAAIEYGNYYRLKGKYVIGIREQYFNEMAKLVDSGDKNSRILAFHFISNTLFNDRDPNEIVDEQFIALLKDINSDSCLKEFCKKRKEFFERNLSLYNEE